MAVYVYVATSLDGFIATSDGGIDWLMEIPNPNKSDFGFAEFISGIDAIVMGRSTFETVLDFGDWPYSRPVFVLSETLEEVPEHLCGKADVIKGSLGSVLAHLRELGYLNLYVDGGRVIQSFLAEDLVDEMIITRIPILLGEGIPLFGRSAERLDFEHKKTEVLLGALTKSYYARKRA